MKARSVLLSTALAAVVAAAAYHWRAVRMMSLLEAERTRISSTVAEQRRSYEATARQVATAQAELQALLADRMKRPALPPAHGSKTPPDATPTPRPNLPTVPASPEVRRLQLQAFVSEQRLRFTELLDRLHFTAENRQAFDRIHAAYQQVMLDDSKTDAARKQARETRDARLQELFGPNYDQWAEANRNQPARAIVAQIVQQTFQSAGALTTAQADELTRIVAQHRLSSQQTGGSQQYDWDRIITDAQPLLADRQREAFVTAVEYRRASEKMSAMAARKR